MKVAIIGAGAAGLAAAFDLTRRQHSVTIYEAASEVGGLASGFRAPHWEWTLERFYHHWFRSDKSVLGLIDELGWSDQVIFPRPYTVIYWQGRFFPFDSIFTNIPLFILRHFSLVDFFRYGLAGAYLRFSPWWKPLERVTAADWTRRWFGQRVYTTQWKPLLISKFGEENLDVVNMAWLWARLHSRTTRLGTFKGGFQVFLDKLADVIKGQGAILRLGCAVTGVRKNADETLSIRTASDAESFDAILSTSSPSLMARLVPDLPDSYSEKLRALRSMGAVVLILSLDRPLTQYYWHNLPKEAGFPFLSLVEHTNFVEAEHYGGDHIVYCGDYLTPDHEYFRLSQEELLERFIPGIQRFNPAFDRGWIKKAWLWKTPYAQPVPPVDHSRNIPNIRTPLPGLYFASMSQVYPWDRGTNYAVEIGRRAARMIAADFERE